MNKSTLSFTAACKGFRFNSPKDRIACRLLETYLPHCPSIQALSKSLAYAMVTPLSYRGGYWSVVFNTNQHFHPNQGLIELRTPPQRFEDLLLIDFSVLHTAARDNLLTQYPTFKTKLITELSIIAKGRSSFIL